MVKINYCNLHFRILHFHLKLQPECLVLGGESSRSRLLNSAAPKAALLAKTQGWQQKPGCSGEHLWPDYSFWQKQHSPGCLMKDRFWRRSKRRHPSAVSGACKAEGKTGDS